MAGLLSDRRRLWLFAAGVALLAIAAVAVFLLYTPRGSSDRDGGGPSISEEASRSIDASGQAVVTSESVLPGSTTPTAVPGTTPPAGGTSGKVKDTFYVMVSWWDDTEKRPAEDAVVTWGASGSWSPSGTTRAQAARFGPFPVGRTSKLTVYPDGKARRAGVVVLDIKSSMLSGSERDGIHIEVRDDAVRVLGNPVSNFEVIFPRSPSG
ncbi:MAG: hypothetical protein Q7W16_07240 [Coriobacteriia bacterium]|nr:hypothetical protein [Coriobacteriia bacterium]